MRIVWHLSLLFSALTSLSMMANGSNQIFFHRFAAPEVQNILYQMDMENIDALDFIFLASNGYRSSITIPRNRVERVLTEGFVSDGATINFNHNSKVGDIKLKPILSTYRKIVTGENNVSAQIICDVFHIDNKPLDCYSRHVLRSAIDKYVARDLIPKIGIELEFVLVRKTQCSACSHSRVSSYDDEPYAASLLNSCHRKLIQSFMTNLEKSGIPIEKFHHESGSGQHEIALVYDDVMTVIDNMVVAMYIIKSTADHYGLKASFMPKVFSGKSSPNCLHMNLSVADMKSGKNAFYDADSATKLSLLGMQFAAGILKHAPDIQFLLSPTINSYKRLASGRAAPQYSSCGQYNKSTMVRIPLISDQGDARVEMRSPDSLCNVYLATAALLTAGIDGIQSNLEAPELVKINLFKATQDEIAALNLKKLPMSMYEAIDRLKVSEFAQRFLGVDTVGAIVRNAYAEIDRFNDAISEWEYDQYL